MPYVQLSNLDFADIKTALKEYLRSQGEFTDFDFTHQQQQQQHEIDPQEEQVFFQDNFPDSGRDGMRLVHHTFFFSQD